MWPKLIVKVRIQKHPRRPLRRILTDTYHHLFDERYGLGWMVLGLLLVILWDILAILLLKTFEENIVAVLLIGTIWIGGILMIVWLTIHRLNDL